MITSHTQKSGFTLVETLVAISILVVVVIGPLTIAQKGIQNARFATEQITAVYLAQEAIEAVRQLRDDRALEVFADTTARDPDNPIDTWAWHQGGGNRIDDSCEDISPNTDANGCRYEPDTSNGQNQVLFRSCSGDQCQLYITSAGTYTHQSGSGNSLSPFTRRVWIREAIPGQAVEVTVRVTWNAQVFGNQPRSVELSTWLYNHYDRFGR